MALEMLSTVRSYTDSRMSVLLEHLSSFSRNCLLQVLQIGPIPNHLAFIMDGNRRYAKNHGLEEGDGHKAGFLALISVLKFCYEIGVKYVTVFAFSIDNFKRRPEEVQSLMDLMLEKIEMLLDHESIVNKHGLRVNFIGNLKLLSEPVRAAAEKVMKATEKNTRAVLMICVAYTSVDEILHSIEQSCKIRLVDVQEPGVHEELTELGINLVEIEKNMRMSVAPDPDILIRSSGATRLSNFLLWQTSDCPLYSPAALWPEIGLWHLVWAVLNFQRSHSYLEKRKKLM